MEKTPATEQEVIERSIKMAAEMGLLRNTVLPIGDDVFAFKYREEYLLLKIDGFSVKNSKPPWATLSDIGWKAVTAALSDIYVKNGMPLYILVSLGATTTKDAVEIMKGVLDAADYYGVPIAGGDTNKAEEEEWIDIASIGVSRNPIPRSTARPGDYVVATGVYGSTGAAYWALYKGVDPRIIAKYECLYSATTRPKAVKGFPKLVETLGECITSSMDVSDGLASTLMQIAKSSNIGIEIRDLPPLASCADDFLRKHAVVDAFKAILYGGEEFEIVFTIKPDCLPYLVEYCEKLLGRKCNIIGRCTAGKPRVTYRGSKIDTRGWNHFSRIYS